MMNSDRWTTLHTSSATARARRPLERAPERFARSATASGNVPCHPGPAMSPVVLFGLDQIIDFA